MSLGILSLSRGIEIIEEGKVIYNMKSYKGEIIEYEEMKLGEGKEGEYYYVMKEETGETIMKQNEMCIEVEVNQSQLTILSKYQDQFKSLSINYKFLQRRIKLLSLPILFDKHITISQFIQMINQIDHDHYFFGFDKIKIIRNIIASHSCRNAIMFNDKLSFTECSHLIHQLSFCDSPFLCAHGRVNVTPLFDMSQI